MKLGRQFSSYSKKFTFICQKKLYRREKIILMRAHLLWLSYLLPKLVFNIKKLPTFQKKPKEAPLEKAVMLLP